MITLKGCHLSSDNSEELDIFARRIGLSRCWYSVHPPVPHYDIICPHIREKAELLLKKKYRKR